VWRNSFGVAGNLSADGNGDGVVDAADFIVWRKAASSPASGAVESGFLTPEPTALALVLTVTVFGKTRRIRALAPGILRLPAKKDFDESSKN
jgi:hypothetical protein